MFYAIILNEIKYMNILSIALKGLKEIIDEKKSYHIVMVDFKNQYNFTKDDFSILSKTIQGTIRHFFLLRYQATNLFNDFEEDDDEIYLICLAIYQIRYLKKEIASFIVINDTIQTNEDYLLRLDNSQIKENLKFVSENKFNLPTHILSDVYKYDSLTFSTPLWLIQLWAKEYGDDILLNLLHTNRNKRPSYLQINQLKSTKEELLKENIYLDISDVDNGLIYSGINSLTSLQDYKQGKIYSLDLTNQIILEKINLDYGDQVLHLSSIKGDLTSYLGCKLIELNEKIDTNSNNEISYRQGKYLYQRLGLKNVTSYLSNIDYLRTYLRYDNYDKVFTTPNSSDLGKISRKPGLLLTLKKNDIDMYSSNQYLELCEADKYLKVGGQLIYIIYTITLEETTNVISKFIDNHQNYNLVEQKQIFPYDNNSDGAYYAILEKGE